MNKELLVLLFNSFKPEGEDCIDFLVPVLFELAPALVGDGQVEAQLASAGPRR